MELINLKEKKRLLGIAKKLKRGDFIRVSVNHIEVEICMFLGYERRRWGEDQIRCKVSSKADHGADEMVFPVNSLLILEPISQSAVMDILYAFQRALYEVVVNIPSRYRGVSFLSAMSRIKNDRSVARSLNSERLD